MRKGSVRPIPLLHGVGLRIVPRLCPPLLGDGRGEDSARPWARDHHSGESIDGLLRSRQLPEETAVPAKTPEEDLMGENSAIEWTDATHNFWFGCRKVSEGCKFCYAERDMTRYGRDFYNVVRAVGFGKPLSWPKPKSLTPWGRLVFVNSWSDFFIEEADAWRDEAWEVIRRTPHLTYQILTKRPERIAEHLPKTCFKCGVGLLDDYCECPEAAKPWPNVWLGTSVEDQKYAEIRIPQLVELPAKVHFLSCEPLLGPIDFRYALPVWSKP